MPRREPKRKDKVDADEGKKEKDENQDNDHNPKSWSSWGVRHNVDLRAREGFEILRGERKLPCLERSPSRLQ